MNRVETGLTDQGIGIIKTYKEDKLPALQRLWDSVTARNSKSLDGDIFQTFEAFADILLELPGVTGVDVNYRCVDGVKTNELSIQVYIKHKKEETSGLLPLAVLPKELDGWPVEFIEDEAYFV